MSVTFFLESSDTEWESAPAVVECGCPGAAAHVFVNGAAAGEWCQARNAMPAAKRPVPFGCKDPQLCREFPLHPTLQLAGVELEVNMTNRNAAHVLEYLGLVNRDVQSQLERAEHAPQDSFMAAVLDAAVLDVDLTGNMSGQDFLGRVVLALGIGPVDEGIPAVESGNAVFCGRRAGYAQDRLAELHALAESAVRLGRNVVWA